METYSKILLSGSTNGTSIPIVQTATLGTLVHTAVGGATNLDEIYLYAYNISADPVKVTIEYGSATVRNNVERILPPETGPYLMVPGWLLQNSLLVTAFAGSANVVSINGYVNRITA